MRALRQSAATRDARIIYVSLYAHPWPEPTTGVRSSWAHAASNAFLRRAFDEADLKIDVVDALSPTWPRDTASPDGIHFLRRRFSTNRLNRRGAKVRDGFTSPPTGAPCIGDAGWPVALALYEHIVSSSTCP